MANESELKRLPEEQKATALAWVEDKVPYREIVELMAKPEPEGFGARTSLGAVSRWIGVWKHEAMVRALNEDAQHGAELEKAEAALGMDLARSRMNVAQQRLYRKALAGGCESSDELGANDAGA